LIEKIGQENNLDQNEAAAYGRLIANNSTSKIRVELAPISGPTDLSP
jgi:hypothetical protein